MATYCIGDLHGRYDLFIKLLKQISFNPETDTLYLLGDVIDKHYGGIQIIQYAMTNSDSCILIRGNHENQFLNMTSAYDTILQNETARAILKEIANCHHHNKRKVQLMEEYSASPSYDNTIEEQINRIVSNFDSGTLFQIKQFVKELLTLSYEDYLCLKAFVETCPRCASLQIEDSSFILQHTVPKSSVETHSTIYIFGHIPVPKLHRAIQDCTYSYDFNYRKIFCWIDDNQNRFIDLDLGSNPIAALRLDDLYVTYYGEPKIENGVPKWVVPHSEHLSSSPTITPTVASFGYNNEFRTQQKAAYITSIDGFNEFLIGIRKRKKSIYYIPISRLLDNFGFNSPYVIENEQYAASSIDDLLPVIREDYTIKSQSRTTNK